MEHQAGWHPKDPGHGSPACLPGASRQMGLLASLASLPAGPEYLVVGTSATGMDHGPAYDRREAGSVEQIAGLATRPVGCPQGCQLALPCLLPGHFCAGVTSRMLLC